MSDVIEKKIIDHYKEHKFHKIPDEQCSTCWSELREHDCKLNEKGFCSTCEKFSNLK